MTEKEIDIHYEVVGRIQAAGLDALKNALKRVRDLGEYGKLKDKMNRFGEQGLRADYEAEEAVIKSLKEAGLPGTIISEEHGLIDLVENPTMLVVLDGIDGTAAYKKGGRCGPMLAIFSNTRRIIDEFTYDDCIFGGVADIKSGEITYAVKGQGSYILYENGKTDYAHVSTRTRLTNEVKIYIDGGENGMAVNDKVFTGPLETIKFKTPPL
ncbi:MAG: Inositol monophosphatase [Candidatus Gottesmanbacteria bacterium GW2011_GWA1_43_11]|uniref:Inositol monophosphatase n=1 Tax=Candidatus Gottesmanbacteria bacterium GW2011_GWA1_43_11 TaxID=1618436 RepID=A0A0G1CDU7_9BACT|nr:MAG: Inositol monophosphatase [Candidatus Gottesmanbacteria bacterium GW2011_GWA1_43_11]